MVYSAVEGAKYHINAINICQRSISWLLPTGMSAYCLYIIAYIFPSPATLISASVIAGIGASCIWTGYVGVCTSALRYAAVPALTDTPRVLYSPLAIRY